MRIKIKKLEEFTNEEKQVAFDKMYKEFSAYIKYCNSDKYHSDNDYDHYLYEAVCKAMQPDFFQQYNSPPENDDNKWLC